jgi:hypothetical protein
MRATVISCMPRRVYPLFLAEAAGAVMAWTASPTAPADAAAADEGQRGPEPQRRRHHVAHLAPLDHLRMTSLTGTVEFQ